MSHTLRYSSTRQEVWRFYWRAWRHPRGLWRTHLFVAPTVALAVFVLRGGAGAKGAIPIALASALVSIAWFPLFPLIAFKPELRTLHLDDRGVETTIGKVSGKRLWSEIRSVEDRDDAIIVTVKSGNAFIIPRRAFTSDVERAELLAQITRWFEAARI